MIAARLLLRRSFGQPVVNVAPEAGEIIDAALIGRRVAEQPPSQLLDGVSDGREVGEVERLLWHAPMLSDLRALISLERTCAMPTSRRTTFRGGRWPGGQAESAGRGD
jgi:hypothetical protein